MLSLGSRARVGPRSRARVGLRSRAGARVRPRSRARVGPRSRAKVRVWSRPMLVSCQLSQRKYFSEVRRRNEPGVVKYTLLLLP